MTIKGLSKLLRDEGVPAHTVDLTVLEGRRVSIDANNLAYVHFARMRKAIIETCNLDIEVVQRDTEISKLCTSVVMYLERLQGAIPVLVFDGEPPEEKQAVMDKRKQQFQEQDEQLDTATERMKACHDEGRIPPLSLKLGYTAAYCKASHPTRPIMDALMSRLEHHGYEVRKADGEGDKLCASLVVSGYCTLAISTDYDLLAFGCPVFAPTFKLEDGAIARVLMLSEVLNTLQLTYPQFLDLCICSGCDYNTNVPRIGVKTVYKRIRAGDSLSDVKAAECVRYDVCRKLFTHHVE